MVVAIPLHFLATVIWVGGMFFAYMALRSVAASLLEPAQRLPLSTYETGMGCPDLPEAGADLRD